ncbi:hypothetical protein N9R28_00480 [Flavobacteriaceae bacterium]|nr:hypothetical protein [Flavobacteriaceae bacterium]MDB4097267.1 hypothetical protein [Flavobacteriaceae bacterium]MDC1396416.1 hypothetical protein [Flavobacteriaceae bacterium]
MRKLFFVFLSFTSIAMFGQAQQKIDLKTTLYEPILGEVIVMKDSISFYSFDKNGVFEFVVLPSKEVKSTYSVYSAPLPLELKTLSFEVLTPLVYNENEVYFLYPGGGLLFRYKDGAIKRVDNTFAHRNQFSGYFFKYKNGIFLLGGYGYWKSNSLLTKFNFETKNWDYITSTGSAPSLGINNGSFVLEKNMLYVFDFYYRIDDMDVKNNNLYTLDLETFKWSKRGSVNNRFFSTISEKNYEIKSKYKNSLLQMGVEDSFFKIITPSENTIKIFSSESLPNISQKAIAIGSNIIYPVFSADRQYKTLTVKNIETLTPLNEEYFTNDFNLFKNYFIYVAVFCLLLIVFTFLKFKKEHVLFFITENHLSGLNKSLKINKDEKFIIELLSSTKNKQIDNTIILNYFRNSKISLDASVKRKNKTIDDLNQKVLEKFELVLIIKRANETDSRQVVYVLNPVIEF